MKMSCDVAGSSSVVTGSKKIGMWSFLRMWWSTKNVSATDLIVQNRVVAGLHLGLLMEQQPSRIQAAMSHLFQLYEEGKIKPRIDSIWPLDKVYYSSICHIFLNTPLT
jgi:NADPH:quinone reductase-like Zn-dependent oxidoreductase